MQKQKPRMLYAVIFKGVMLDSFYSLNKAMLHIGMELNDGKRFGCMLHTAKAAVEAGYTIEQYREFL